MSTMVALQAMPASRVLKPQRQVNDTLAKWYSSTRRPGIITHTVKPDISATLLRERQMVLNATRHALFPDRKSLQHDRLERVAYLI